jgi:hypothetical protein
VAVFANDFPELGRRTPAHLAEPVAEHLFGSRVGVQDHAVGILDQHATSDGFVDRAQALLRVGQASQRTGIGDGDRDRVGQAREQALVIVTEDGIAPAHGADHTERSV